MAWAESEGGWDFAGKKDPSCSTRMGEWAPPGSTATHAHVSANSLELDLSCLSRDRIVFLPPPSLVLGGSNKPPKKRTVSSKKKRAGYEGFCFSVLYWKRKSACVFYYVIVSICSIDGCAAARLDSNSKLVLTLILTSSLANKYLIWLESMSWATKYLSWFGFEFAWFVFIDDIFYIIYIKK